MSRHISMHDIEATVCARFKLSTAEMHSDDRARRIARPRQIAMFLAKERTDLSYPQIGMHFGRDHSTAVHAVGRIGKMLVTHPKVAAYVDECRAALPVIDEAAVRLRKARLRYMGELCARGVMSWPAHLPPPVELLRCREITLSESGDTAENPHERELDVQS